MIVDSIPGTVISTPILPYNQGLPDSDATQFYTIHLSNDNIFTIAASEMPSIIPTTTSNALPLAVPAWICSNHKVLYQRDGIYLRGFL